MGDKHYIIFFFLIILGFALFLAGLTFFQDGKSDKFGGLSTLSFEPTSAPTMPPDPDLIKWNTYSSPNYNFSIDIPDGWFVQDYQKAFLTGGTLVAFSPTELPCETCSYFYNGHFSIRIFNDKTDPIYFEDYTKRLQQVGKNKDYQLVQLDNKKGVAYANTIALENQGWVYEIALDINNGKAKITDSKIFQRALNSLRFTDVLFSQ